MPLQPSEMIEALCNTEIGGWPKRAYLRRSLFEAYRIECIARADHHSKFTGEYPHSPESERLAKTNELEFKGVKLCPFDPIGPGPIISVQRPLPASPQPSS